MIVATNAHADPDAFIAPTRAAQLFDEGRKLKEAGKIDEACARFAVSWQAEKALGTEVNLADCREREGRLLDAWRLFDEAARLSEQQGNQTRAVFARNRADAIEPRLAKLEIRFAQVVPGTVLIVDGHELPVREIVHERFDPKPVWIRVSAPGGKPFAQLVNARSGKTTVDVPVLVQTKIERRRSRLWLAGGSALLGVTGLLVGKKLGDLADSERAKLETIVGCSPNPMVMGGIECNSDAAGSEYLATDARANRFATAEHVLIGGSVLALTAAAVIWYTAPKERVIITPTATTSSVGVALGTRF